VSQPSPRDVTAAIPWGVRLTAAWAWRLLLVVLGIAGIVTLLAFTKVLWVPVVIATLLTVLLQPVVAVLTTRLHLGRGLASALTVLALLAAVAGLLALAGGQILQGIGDLWDQARTGLDEVVQDLAGLGLDQAQLDRYVSDLTDSLQSNSGSLVSGALSVTTTLGHVLAGALITVFCLVFFLKDGAIIWTWLVRLLPDAARARTHEAARRGLVTLGGFTRTQILVALIDAVGIGLGAAILGLPLVVPLAVLVFLASFIPFVGAIATGAIAVLVAVVDQGVGTALIMLAIVLLVQQVESHVLQPFLLGHAVSLHPVAVLLSVAAGSLAAGIVGALIAVPFVATLNTVVLHLHGYDKFPALGSDADGLAARLTRLRGLPAELPPVTDEKDA
jgi:predicted PurR-regulated permease PerM